MKMIKGKSLKEKEKNSVKRDDASFLSFKTTKNQENKKNKEKEDKSMNINYMNETPGIDETPNGTTPGPISSMKVSKEELIKISTEPVANYYSIIKDLGHGSYGQAIPSKRQKNNNFFIQFKS